MNKKIVFILFMVCLLSLTSCTNVQRRDNKVLEELEDRGWECDDTWASFSCELVDEGETYYVSSVHIIVYFGYENETVWMSGMTQVNLQTGEFTHHIDGHYLDESLITYRISGNVYSGELDCETNDQTLLFHHYDRIEDSFDTFVEIINASGNSIKNYNQHSDGPDVSLPESLGDSCTFEMD